MNNSIRDILSIKSGMARLLLFVIISITSITLSQFASAQVTANLDRTHINNGDTITLHIMTSGKDLDNQPDLSPLKKDFEVLGTSSSSQIQIINGYRTDKHEWQIELAPRKQGQLTIPALNVGNSKTSPLTLTVSTNNTSSSAQSGDPVFIKSEISSDPGNAYVQQQILYTTRLYYRIPLVEGSFTNPIIDNAVVEQLGEDKQYNTTVKGQSYQVLERRYAIFPELSGTLTIPSVIFNGRMVAQQQSPFGQVDSMFQQMLNQSGFNASLFNGTAFGNSGKRVHFTSNSITLPIKPQPPGYSGSNWLPTQSMDIRDSWATTPPVIHAGEPVTRSLTIEAKGLEASQLPDINLPGSDSVRVYPEKAKQSNRTDGNWIYGKRVQRFTYVSSQPGKVHFPAVKITWWNTNTHKEMITTLPAYDLTVLPGSGQSTSLSSSTTPGAAKSTTPATTTLNTEKNKPGHKIKQGVNSSHTRLSYWIIFSAVLSFSLFIVAFLVFRNKPGNVSENTALKDQFNSVKMEEINTENKSLSTRKKIEQSLHHACMNNQARETEKLLLNYAEVVWPQDPPRSLAAIASLSTSAVSELIELEKYLYSSSQLDWDGKSLWQRIKDGLDNSVEKSSMKQPHEVPQLYPDWKNVSKKAG